MLRVVFPEHLKSDMLSEYHAGENGCSFLGTLTVQDILTQMSVAGNVW